MAKELGICIDTLRSWLKGSAGVSIRQADRQNREARRLRELESEVRTLRKQVAENFFSCLKCELIRLRRFDIHAAAQNAVFAYIEGFYNALRPHSAIGWVASNVFAKRFSKINAA